ncbi:hypothetical protein MMC20_008022 [Loxospora ochrophaea]|nr:hypothetical protein [Loxospora ochrophaea]
MPAGLTARRKVFLSIALVLVILLYSALQWRQPPISPPFSLDLVANDSNAEKENPSTQADFWRALESLLASTRPDCPSPTRLGNVGALGFDRQFNNGSEVPTVKPELLSMPDQDVERMRQAHANFVENIRAKNASALDLVYTPGTRGLVSTAGGRYLPVFVISLRMLRRTGCSLPMEVFLRSDEEYESYICESVLPSLNAKCVIISQILKNAASPQSLDVAHYQLKSFAIIFSSFEDLLFLDADCFPVQDPTSLFSSEPFVSYGLVTWPDFWIISASYFYYRISSQAEPPTTSRASSEAGEIFYSKRKHQESILLSTYYNYYGPSHYYRLLSQGGPGEGDKETFLAAAAALSEPYYATSETVRSIGHQGPEGKVSGSAMVQFDVAEDFRLTQQGLWRVKDPSVAIRPRPLFVHANFPKFNPATIFRENRPTRNAAGGDHRAWQDKQELLNAFEIDVERRFWEEIKGTACELEDKFENWAGKPDICNNVTKYWRNVFETP